MGGQRPVCVVASVNQIVSAICAYSLPFGFPPFSGSCSSSNDRLTSAYEVICGARLAPAPAAATPRVLSSPHTVLSLSVPTPLCSNLSSDSIRVSSVTEQSDRCPPRLRLPRPSPVRGWEQRGTRLLMRCSLFVIVHRVSDRTPSLAVLLRHVAACSSIGRLARFPDGILCESDRQPVSPTRQR